MSALGTGEKISIHAPHEGERPAAFSAAAFSDKRFQSTLPTRGSDLAFSNGSILPLIFQSTLPTRGSDLRTLDNARVRDLHFNPRSPRGGATIIDRLFADLRFISIHAPHEGERPSIARPLSAKPSYFNPRSPRGGATGATSAAAVRLPLFQSTLPTRGSDPPSCRYLQRR